MIAHSLKLNSKRCTKSYLPGSYGNLHNAVDVRPLTSEPAKDFGHSWKLDSFPKHVTLANQTVRLPPPNWPLAPAEMALGYPN